MPCAQRIIATLARQAFRRPPTDADTEMLMRLLQGGPAGGRLRERHPHGGAGDHRQPEVRLPLRAAGGAGGPRRPRTTASPTSSWRRACPTSCGAARPDEPLLAVAAAGRLREPAVLEREVQRMLADRRAEALMDNFAAQWLRLQTVKEADPDGGLFPNFTRNLGQSMTPRDEAALRQHRARGPQHPRPAHRRLHVRGRSAGQALRHPERGRAAVPPCRRSPTRIAAACSDTPAC